MSTTQALRPFERRVLHLVHDGVELDEVARRFRRSPEFVQRVVDYTDLPRGRTAHSTEVLRPLERRILKWRAAGADHAEIGRRFHRSAGHTARVEHLARYKLETR